MFQNNFKEKMTLYAVRTTIFLSSFGVAGIIAIAVFKWVMCNFFGICIL